MGKVGKPQRHGKGWRVRWVDHLGIRRSQTFKEFKNASTHLQVKLLEKEKALVGLIQPTIEGKTFDDLCDHWLKNVVITKKSTKDHVSVINTHLRPYFGVRLLKQISTEYIDQFVRSKSHLSPKTINNHLTMLSTMLNRAQEMNWLLQPPKIRKLSNQSSKDLNNYLRTEEEVRRFLLAASQEPLEVYAVYAFAIATGARQGEVAGLKRSNVDFDRGLIRIVNSFDNETTKNGKVRVVPLFDELRPILKKWIDSHSNEFVFPSKAGTMLQPSARIFQERLHKVLDRAGFPKVERRKKLRPYVTFHGFRHTFTSLFAARGGNMFKLQRILGHSTSEMTEHYSHLDIRAFSDELCRLNGLIPNPSHDEKT